MKSILYTSILFSLIVLSSCLSDDLAFDVVESPVLAVFEDVSSTDMLTMTATFYELDKSGILDQAIGIDSMPISGLEISVYIEESALIGSYITDASGKVSFESSLDALGTSSRLEWVGTYNDTPFRIYKNF